MLKLILMVGAGSFAGGVSRFIASRLIQESVSSSFPYGTFIVNILGCFLIGLFYGLSERGNLLNTEWRMFLTVGFCGGFTTFSTFSGENIAMLRDGSFFLVALYISLSLFFCLIATWFGNLVTKLL